jgi:DNA repair protein RadC
LLLHVVIWPLLAATLNKEGPKQHQAPITAANSRTTNARLSQDGSQLLDESLNEGDGVARVAGQVSGANAAHDAVIARALRIMESRLRYHDVVLTSPQAVRDYLRLRIANREHEVFVALFVDSQNRLIAAEELFRGTLAQTSVYPREVVKAALKHNAAAVIFAHNHPSGIAEPSRADELLTQALKQALALVDCRTLDHIVVAGEKTTSFAERGLL